MMKNIDIAIKYVTFLALVIVVLGVLGILTYKQGKVMTNSQKNTITSTSQPEPSNQYRLGLTFTGDNDQMFDLRQGIAEFETTYFGEGKFSANIMRIDGTVLFNLADREGSFKEKKNFIVPETGVYILSVKCNGEWSILRK